MSLGAAPKLRRAGSMRAMNPGRYTATALAFPTEPPPEAPPLEKRSVPQTPPRSNPHYEEDDGDENGHEDGVEEPEAHEIEAWVKPPS